MARLIALDIDGTLLSSAQPISPAARRAVRAAVARGEHVVLASGRTMAAVLPIVDQLELTSGYAICGNGALVLDVAARRPLRVTTFAPAPVLALIEATLPGAIYAAEEIGVGNRVTGRFADGLITGAQLPVTFDELRDAPVARLAAFWTSRSAAEVVAAFAELPLPGATATVDHEAPWLVVVCAGLSKARALEELRVRLGVACDATFAVGDGLNDIEMLRWAGHGVAMGQAPEEVRAAADEVTGTLARDGLATALSRLAHRESSGRQ